MCGSIGVNILFLYFKSPDIFLCSVIFWWWWLRYIDHTLVFWLLSWYGLFPWYLAYFFLVIYFWLCNKVELMWICDWIWHTNRVYLHVTNACLTLIKNNITIMQFFPFYLNVYHIYIDTTYICVMQITLMIPITDFKSLEMKLGGWLHQKKYLDTLSQIVDTFHCQECHCTSGVIFQAWFLIANRQDDITTNPHLHYNNLNNFSINSPILPHEFNKPIYKWPPNNYFPCFCYDILLNWPSGFFGCSKYIWFFWWLFSLLNIHIYYKTNYTYGNFLLDKPCFILEELLFFWRTHVPLSQTCYLSDTYMTINNKQFILV